MTKAFIIAIALASITAAAQTETTAPAETTTAQEQAATPAAKNVTKKTKKKKAKPSAKQTQQQVDELAKSSGANIPKAPTATNVDTVSPKAGTAAGTSAASVAADVGPKKNWALKAQVYSTTDYANTQNIQNLTTLGGSYKVLPKLTLKAAQTFETLTNGRETSDDTRELTKASNFRASYTDLGVGSSLPGVLGSDEMPVSVNFKLLGGSSELTTTGKYSSAYSFVEGNISTPFTISPKWSLSIDSQWRHVNMKDVVAEDRNRFLTGPTLTYTINDFVSIYQSAAYILGTKQNFELRRNAERMYLETGIAITPVKNLNISFNIDQDKGIYASPTSGYEVSNFSLYKPTEASAAGRTQEARDNATLDSVSIEALVTYAY